MWFLLLGTYSSCSSCGGHPSKEPSQLYIDWSWLQRWMAARPWESHVFDNNSVSEDVFNGCSLRVLIKMLHLQWK